MLLKNSVMNDFKFSPVADPSLLYTITVMSVVDRLLRINITCTGPLSSSMVYVDWPKFTLGANNKTFKCYMVNLWNVFAASVQNVELTSYMVF